MSAAHEAVTVRTPRGRDDGGEDGFYHGPRAASESTGQQPVTQYGETDPKLETRTRSSHASHLGP